MLDLDDLPGQAAAQGTIEDLLGGGVPSSGVSGAASTNDGSLLDIMGPNTAASSMNTH